MKKDDCIFCKIANGEIPSRTIYEDDNFKCFLDLDPATKGHALIVPKEHYDNLFELGDKEAKALIPVAKKLANTMMDRLGAEGMNLVQNNGEIAGQTVHHFHLHLIPRYTGDNNEDKIGWNHCGATENDLNEVLNLLK